MRSWILQRGRDFVLLIVTDDDETEMPLDYVGDWEEAAELAEEIVSEFRNMVV